ncbi:MAG TPA: sigma-70 family RNA polymerase sigma factor [Solirubrobacteraceae bacterium]|nr:sigma-70 family RNA polymerase sigma factor [Solirubrobacteraceae bacterium]
MDLVQGGNAEAFELVYDRHCDVAFSLAYRICGRRASAEDVLQEAFLAAWRSGARYDRQRGSVRNWILRIVRNRAIDALRRGSVRDRHNLDDEGIVERLPAEEHTEERVLQLEQEGAVKDLLKELPSEQRRVIELAYFGGFTHTEIATMLEMPIGTIKGRMRLGLAKMRVAMPSEESLLR